MDEKIRVLIFDVADSERDELVNLLINVDYIVLANETDSFYDAEREVEEKDIDVILLGADVEGDGYEVAERLYARYPYLAIIILENTMQEERLHKAFYVGIKDILYSPYKLENVVDSVYKAYQNLQAAAQTNEAKPRVRKNTSMGQIYTIAGTKGGVGRTFVAVNTAIALKKLTDKKVVLIDLNLEFGNVDLTLNLEPRANISHVLDDIRNIDSDMIESYLISHESGIQILASGAQPMSNEYVHSEDIQNIIQILQLEYDYVVIDMPARFDDKVNSAYLISDKIFVVATPEVSSLRNTKIAMLTLEEIGIQKSKMYLMLNKIDKKNDIIKKKDVETTLNREIYASFTYDIKNVMSSVNLGTPVFLNKSAKILKAEFTKLGNNILGSKGKTK